MPQDHGWITANFILFPKRRVSSAGSEETEIRVAVCTSLPIRTAPSLILRAASVPDEARPHLTSTLSSRILGGCWSPVVTVDPDSFEVVQPTSDILITTRSTSSGTSSF